MKHLSIFIISLLVIVLTAFYGAAHFYTVDDAQFAGPVPVPVYVPSEPVAVEPGGTMVPLRQSRLPQAKAPSVQTADQLTAGSTTGWNLTAISDAQTQSVGGGASAISAGNAVASSASTSVVPVAGNYAMVLPTIAEYRQKAPTSVATLSVNDNPLTLTRRKAQPNEPGFDPSDSDTWPDDWPKEPDYGESVDDAAGNRWWWNFDHWEQMDMADPVNPTPIGDAPWWLIAGGLLLYAGYKRKLQTTQN